MNLSMSPTLGTNLEEEASQLELAVIQTDVWKEAREGIALSCPQWAGLALEQRGMAHLKRRRRIYELLK